MLENSTTYSDDIAAEICERIIEAVEAVGGWFRLGHNRIVLRWRGDMPNAGKLIDRIRACRTGVVAALATGLAAETCR